MTTGEVFSASLEDYLEALFHIIEQKQAARAKDIAKRLNVSGPSVTGALKLLSEKELINYAPYDIITLTEKGKEVAEDVIRRHETLREFFVKVLSVDEPAAEEAACRMEHEIPRAILERLIHFIKFVEACPLGKMKWKEGFGYYCKHGQAAEVCKRCVSMYREDLEKTNDRVRKIRE